MSQVVVGLVTYNSIQDLPDCIKAVRAQTFPHLRLFVIDNASADGSPDWVKRNVPEATLLCCDRNLGYGRAHNQILGLCQLGAGDFYLTLNPDVRIHPDYITELRDGLVVEGAGWGTGKLKWIETTRQGDHRLYSVGHGLRRDGYFFNIGYGIPDRGQFETCREVFGAPGAAALYARPLIESISHNGAFFDEDFFLYGEDTDVDWRAHHAGWRCVYVPSAIADHRGSNPGEGQRVEAIVNRYLSVFKNARVLDLLGYNLPVMMMHVAFRLVASPRLGFRMGLQLAATGPRMLAKRPTTMMSRKGLKAWFAWSREQETGQPLAWKDRLNAWIAVARG